MKHIKVILAIICSVMMLIGILFSIDARFTKSSTTEKIDNRLELNIQDDRIFQKRQDVERYKSMTKFKRKEEPPTVSEKEVIQHEEENLMQLKQQREEIIMRQSK